MNRIGVSAMTALSLLALYMYLRQTTALVRQREERRRQVQSERDQLEREVQMRTAQLTELAQPPAVGARGRAPAGWRANCTTNSARC